MTVDLARETSTIRLGTLVTSASFSLPVACPHMNST